MEILNERPADMTFQDYRNQLKFQKAWIKQHKQGRLYYLSVDTYYAPEDIYKMFGLKQTYPPFRGKAKTDLLYPI